MRIVLFLLKSMNQVVRALGHNFLHWLDSSFCVNIPKLLEKNRFHVMLDVDENDLLLMELGGREVERFALLSGVDDYYVGKAQCYRVNQLEALTLILEAIGKSAFKETWVWISRPSLLPCVYDYESNILVDKLYTIKRSSLFKKIMKDVKKIGVRYNLNIVLVENRELLGRKKSALIERLFV